MALPEEVIHSGRVPRIGPYSQAVRVGNLVFTAGQAGIDPATGVSAGPTFDAQARQALANLRAVLEDAGTGLHRVVKVTCFVADADAFANLNELFTEFRDRPRCDLRPSSLFPRAYCSRSMRLQSSNNPLQSRQHMESTNREAALAGSLCCLVESGLTS